MIFFLGAFHKLRHPVRGDLPKGSNMGDKGEGGMKNLKKKCDIIYGRTLNIKRILLKRA